MDLRENGLHGLLGNGLKGKWTSAENKKMTQGKMDLRGKWT